MGLKKRYKNPHIKRIKRSPLHFAAWFLGFYRDKAKTKIVPDSFSYPLPSYDESKNHKATFIGHCTYLIETGSCTILTDPIWSNRCSPVSFMGPKRKHQPHMQIEDIKSLDFVLISHNHYDHLDYPSIKEIYKKFPKVTFIVPVGLKKWFIKRGVDQVVELDWWQDVNFCEEKNSPQIEITAVPAQHHSGRGMFDANRSLWVGYVVKVKHKGDEKCFYFAGDTAYNSHDFKNIGSHFRNIDLSICPIGTYVPKKFMETVHLSPEGAVSIHKDIKAKLSLGMHWGTFCLSEELHNAPPYDLYNEMQRQGQDITEFLPIPPGHAVNW